MIDTQTAPSPVVTPARVAPKRLNRIFAIVVLFYLLLPHCFNFPESPETGHLGLARVYSGDEPHYLIFLNSLILDGDLDLANNYNSAYAGTEQAGLRFRCISLDHHSMWFVGRQIRHWFEFYRTDSPTELKPGVSDPGPHAELPWNVPGLSILLAPFLFPLRGTTYLEPAALLLSAAAAFGSFLLVRALFSSYLGAGWNANLAAFVTVLGTPLWHYSRALFPEGFLAFFLLACFWHYFKERYLLAGAFLALAILLKPPIGLAGAPLLAEMCVRRWIKPLALFCFPLAIATAGFLGLNALLYGHPLNAPSDIYFQAPFLTLFRQMFSLRGIIPFAPIAILGLMGWPAFLRTQTRPAVLLLCSFCTWYIFMAFLENWDGGFAYGPRILVPIIPFLLLGLVGYFLHFSKAKQYCFYGLGLVSITINALGSIPYWEYWRKYPPQELLSGLFN